MSDKPALQPLSGRQNDVLTFIRSYRVKHGISPTLREISEIMGISTTSVHEHMQVLVSKGHLIRTEGVSRGFVPAEEPKVVLGGALGVVDRAFEGKPPEAAIGNLHSEITTGLKALPHSN